jgi:hypothetical protein
VLPKHPASERASCVFHAAFGTIGIVHMIVGARTKNIALAIGHLTGGAAMAWFHFVGAFRHWEDRECQ